MRRDRVDEIILNIYRETLHDATLEETDNFFDKGGNSLTAAKICRLIRKEVNVPIAITDVFKYPNVKMLLENIRQMIFIFFKIMRRIIFMNCHCSELSIDYQI